MNIRRHFERILLGFQVAVDALAIAAGCLAGFQLMQLLGDYGFRLPREEYYPIFLWTLGVTLALFGATGMYSTRKSLLNVQEFERLGRSAIIAFLIVNALVFLLRNPEPHVGAGRPIVLVGLEQFFLFRIDDEKLSRGTIVFSFAFLFLFVASERFLFFKLIQAAHRRGIGHHHVLIVGAGPVGQKIREKLIVSPTIGWNLRGFLDDDPDLQGKRVDGVPVIGTTADLERCVAERKVRTIFVSTPESDETRILEIVRRGRSLGVEVCVVPRLWQVLSYPVQIERLDSIPLIVPRRTVQSLSLSIVKRVIDLAGAISFLLLNLPFFLVLPILIKWESRGSAFFRQKRIGKDGRVFEMLKFRTMRAEVSTDAIKPQRSDDPRVTALGRWLRRLSIDEIPQFWNVLKGEMSLVGPRPEMPFVVQGYSEADRARLAVKPGITGLWQISYARRRPIHANLDYDLYYVEHQSLVLDLVILFLTPFALVKGTGAR